MDNNFDNVSYGDGQTNFFGAKSSAELQGKLANCSKAELRGLASKVGLNPNYTSHILRDMIAKAFREYQAKNAPIPAPKQMFSEASEDVKDMIASVGKVRQDEREEKKRVSSKKKTGKSKNK